MDQAKSQTTVIPHSQKPLVTRKYPSEPELDELISKSAKAQAKWSQVALKERIEIGKKFMVSSYFLQDHIIFENEVLDTG